MIVLLLSADCAVEKSSITHCLHRYCGAAVDASRKTIAKVHACHTRFGVCVEYEARSASATYQKYVDL